MQLVKRINWWNAWNWLDVIIVTFALLNYSLHIIRISAQINILNKLNIYSWTEVILHIDDLVNIQLQRQYRVPVDCLQWYSNVRMK